MTPWHLGPLTAFDLESTGINSRTVRIVTGYVATFGPKPPRGPRPHAVGASVLINPGVPIPVEASNVHGITDEIARVKGCTPVDGINSIAQAVARSLAAQIPVVGHNLAYDFTLLYYECLRHGVPTVAERLGRPPAAAVGPIIDTYVLDKQVDQYRSGSRKLDDSKGPGVATHYGVPLTAAHTADADAVAAVRVAVKIAERYPGEIPTDARALHHMQKLWRADQAASLQRWLRTKPGGDPATVVDPCWPVCTDDTHSAD